VVKKSRKTLLPPISNYTEKNQFADLAKDFDDLSKTKDEKKINLSKQ